ncbi:MAG TPA: hypothetical protein VJB90_04005 [Candidatus Nanoarchaeia archaeon]|nr:hypothetical protein [Candidatus Nanoarchaeia archaeon]
MKQVLAILALGIVLLAAIAVIKAPNLSGKSAITGLTATDLPNDVKYFKISVMNTDKVPRFCQGVVNVTKDGVLLKTIKQDAGVLNPRQEKQVEMQVQVPSETTATAGTFCT